MINKYSRTNLHSFENLNSPCSFSIPTNKNSPLNKKVDELSKECAICYEFMV